MLFNSAAFLVFFPLVTLAFFALPRQRVPILFVASCYFYMAFIPAYLLILFFLIAVDVLFADVNGDDRADLVGRHRSNGDVWVLPSTGSDFTLAALWSYGWTSGYRISVADGTGDGRADLVAQ